MEALINDALNKLTLLIESSFWLAPVLAFFAGILTSATPCSLSGIPLVIAFVGGTGRKNTAAAFRYSAVFAAGTALTYTALGTLASLFGKIFSFGNLSWWYLILGSLMVALALQTWGIITIIPSTYAQRKNSRRGYCGALLSGILGGLFSSPCATPVLVALLALVAKGGNPLWGIILLFLYSAGHSVLVIAAGTFMGLPGKLAGNPKYGYFAAGINIFLGLSILLAGLYLLYLGF